MNPLTDDFSYVDGRLSSEGVSLQQVAETVGTPCYVYSQRSFLSRLDSLHAGLKGLDALVCFAVKACSNVSILRMLGDAGAGADLVSGGELARAIHAGIPPERMVFSGVGKTAEELKTALGKGIYSFHVESRAELELLNRLALESGKPAPVALRLNPDVDAQSHPYISTGLKKDKFGLSLAEVLEIARQCASGKLKGVALHGLSIHIGSQLVSLRPLDEAFRKTRQAMARVEKILGQALTAVDVGGGVGIPYKKGQKCPSATEYTRLVRKHFGPGSGLGGPLRVILEPGRFLAGNSGVLLTRILYPKQRGARRFLIVDAAMNDLIRPSLYQSHHEIVPLERSRASGKQVRTDVVGPVCESGDLLALGRALAQKLATGDLLAILSAGAYGFSMSSQYNSRPRPPEVLIQDGRFRIIRRRETQLDLLGPELEPEPGSLSP